jgi:hypothetical protein
LYIRNPSNPPPSTSATTHLSRTWSPLSRALSQNRRRAVHSPNFAVAPRAPNSPPRAPKFAIVRFAPPMCKVSPNPLPLVVPTVPSHLCCASSPLRPNLHYLPSPPQFEPPHPPPSLLNLSSVQRPWRQRPMHLRVRIVPNRCCPGGEPADVDAPAPLTLLAGEAPPVVCVLHLQALALNWIAMKLFSS